MKRSLSTLGSKLAAPVTIDRGTIILVLIVGAFSFLADLLGLDGWQWFLVVMLFAAVAGSAWRVLESLLSRRTARRLDRTA